MWKLTTAILILVSAALSDPVRVQRLLEPSLQVLGSTIRSALDIQGFLSPVSGERRR